MDMAPHRLDRFEVLGFVRCTNVSHLQGRNLPAGSHATARQLVLNTPSLGLHIRQVDSEFHVHAGRVHTHFTVRKRLQPAFSRTLGKDCNIAKLRRKCIRK